MFGPSRNGNDGYDPGAYGRAVADVYDDLYSTVPETDEAVEMLAELAGDDGAVLEMGIGTGRLALPLARRGVAVAGIEGSQEMVDELRTKPGGEDMPVAVGNFADAEVEGAFSVVVLALHTIFGLPSAEDQIRCFENAARHLEPGGVFVVEARVMDAADFRDGQAIEPRFFDEHQAEIQIQTLRRRQPAGGGHERAPLRGRRGAAQRVRQPVHDAARVRPHGPHRRVAAARSVGVVAARIVHRALAPPRVGV